MTTILTKQHFSYQPSIPVVPNHPELGYTYGRGIIVRETTSHNLNDLGFSEYGLKCVVNGEFFDENLANLAIYEHNNS